MGALTFKTTLQKRGPAAAVVLDDDQVSAIGEGAKRFPVAEAKREETRDRRVTEALEMLHAGKTIS